MNRQSLKSVLIFALFLGLFVAFTDALLTLLHKPAGLNSFGQASLPVFVTAVFLTLLFFPGVWLLRIWSAKLKWRPHRDQIILFLSLVAVTPLFYGLGIPDINTHTWPYLKTNLLIFLGLSLILFRLIFSSRLISRLGFLFKIWVSFKKSALPVLFVAVNLLWLFEYPMTRTPGIIKAAVTFISLALAGLSFLPGHRPAKMFQNGWISLILMLILLSGIPVMRRDLIKISKPSGGLSVRPPEFNVFLITIDALRPDFLSCYNPNAAMKTPAIDSLAASGILFENAFSPSTWTKPSIASLMTGLSPVIHQVNTHQSVLPDEFLTLAEALDSMGMQTAGIGYNYLVSEKFNFDQGFQYCHFFPKNTPGARFGLGMKIVYQCLPLRMVQGETNTENLINLTIDYCRSNQDYPFFLWLHIFDPHFPYRLPDRYLPEPILSDPARAVEIRQNIHTVEKLTDDGERKFVRKIYRAEIGYVDDQLQRLFTYLRTSGCYDRSLIIISSDHGEELWEHDGYGHGKTLFNETLKVPLIFKFPQGTAGIMRRRIPEPVSMLSLMPTLLEFCGYPAIPDYFAGSLRFYWEKTGPVSGPPLFCATRFLKADLECIVADSLKYIRDNNKPEKDLVFNWTGDTGETCSITKSHPDQAQRLSALLDSTKNHLLRMYPRPALSDIMMIQHTPADLERLRSLGYIK